MSDEGKRKLIHPDPPAESTRPVFSDGPRVEVEVMNLAFVNLAVRERDRLRDELAAMTRERDAIAVMWFRELADTLKGEERLYDFVGPDIYTGVDDETAIDAARKAAGLTEGPR